MLLNKGMLLGDRYKIVNQTGSGGMANVYKANDIKLNRYVAVKVLKEEFSQDDEFIERFKTEAHAAAGLNHPGIVNVYDVGIEGMINYIVMELVEGKTLKDLIERDAPFPEKTVLGIAFQIANALQTAHKNHIIHRDIKPQNILVSEDGSIKVTDFGIARAVSAKTISTKGGVMGSVHYFSPEQARGGFVDEKSDIYSLGIVIYEMVTGQMPYNGDTSVEIALKHISDELPAIEFYNPNASRSMIAIVEKATAKRAEDRYQSIDELIFDLKRAVKDKSGEFVERKQDDSYSQTLTMDSGELKEIQNKSKTRRVYTDGQDHNYIANKYSKKTKEDERADRKIVIAAIATSLIIIMFISFFGARYLLSGKKVDNYLEELVGQTFEYAKYYAKSNEFSLISTEEYDDTVEKGLIISQDIEEGTPISAHLEVNVVVSLGQELFPVPNICNIDEGSVKSILGENFRAALPTYEYNDTVPINVVIEQSPDAGTMAERGETIQYVISRGPEPKMVSVPDVLGEAEATAKRLIESVGLVVEVGNPIESNRYDKGLVAAQSIKDGSDVLKGTIITIMVSSGPAKIEEEIPEEQKPQGTSKSFTINPSSLPDGDELVNVRLIYISDRTGTSTEVYNENRSAISFPYDVDVTVKESGRVQLYIDGKAQWEDRVSVEGN